MQMLDTKGSGEGSYTKAPEHTAENQKIAQNVNTTPDIVSGIDDIDDLPF